MTTAKRTTLVRHLHLDIGYEQDVEPAVLAGAILESLEAELVEEMGIVSVQADSGSTPGARTLTIYAPLEVILPPTDSGEPPQSPASGGVGDPRHLPPCPICEDIDASCTCADLIKREDTEGDTKEEGRKPNIG